MKKDGNEEIGVLKPPKLTLQSKNFTLTSDTCFYYDLYRENDGNSILSGSAIVADIFVELLKVAINNYDDDNKRYNTVFSGDTHIRPQRMDYGICKFIITYGCVVDGKTMYNLFILNSIEEVSELCDLLEILFMCFKNVYDKWAIEN